MLIPLMNKFLVTTVHPSSKLHTILSLIILLLLLQLLPVLSIYLLQQHIEHSVGLCQAGYVGSCSVLLVRLLVRT